MSTVLVVEDNPMIRLGAVAIVEDAGLVPVEAANADEAIKILELRRDISVVFTDVDMPGSMDGLKLAHYVRDRWPPIQIIVASGEVIVEHGMLPTGVPFFPKPYPDNVVAATLRRMIAVGAAVGT